MDKEKLLTKLRAELVIVDECIQRNTERLIEMDAIGLKTMDVRTLITAYEGERAGLRRAIQIVRG